MPIFCYNFIVKGKLETLSFTKDKIDKLENLLDSFCSQTNTVWVMLTTTSGHLLAQRGFVYSFDVLTINALACGIFSSTMALANLIGEKNFKEFLQEGKKKSIYYITVNENYLLVSLFDDRTIAGVVKVASKEFSTLAEKILSEAR